MYPSFAKGAIVHIAGVLLGWVLLGQGPAGGMPSLQPSFGAESIRSRPSPSAGEASNSGGRPGSRFGTETPGARPLDAGAISGPSGRGARRSTGAADMMADAARLPQGATLTGQPMTLVNAIGSGADRRAQLEIVRAYWRLFAAAADYRYASDYAKTVEPLRLRGSDSASLRAARAAASAQLRQSELEAIAAQHELATLLRQPTNAQLPLCTDRPYVGVYGTRFKEQFASRTPPEQARLADKTIPLQQRVVDDRAAAVQAADNALQDVSDDYQSGRGDASAVLACSRELLRQRQLLVRAAVAYNRNIAAYVFLVVPLGATPQDLVGCLIGPASGAGGTEKQPARPGGPTAAVPREPTLARRPRPSDPTPDGWRSPEPTPAAPPRMSQPTLAPQLDSEVPSARGDRDISRSRDTSSPSPLWRTTNKPPMLPGLPGDTIPDFSAPRQFPGDRPATQLPDVPPAHRAKQLARSLHWDRALWEGESSKPVSLLDCLSRDAGGNRQATVNAYWLVWQRAAQFKSLTNEVDSLKALSAIVMERRNSPAGATDMVRLHVAQTAAQADRDEAQVALVEAQHALAVRIGMVAESAWPRPSTPPHAGSYQLNLEKQSRSVADSRAAARLSALIPGLGQNLQQQAAAVTEADAARTATAEGYRQGMAAIDQVIDSVASQAEQTAEFLDSLADYNRAIAEYAILARPGVAADKLVESLVAKP
ncbi:MAG: hypothetical protein ABFC96_19110 [Thermoguttaceae bacterium]